MFNHYITSLRDFKVNVWGKWGIRKKKRRFLRLCSESPLLFVSVETLSTYFRSNNSANLDISRLITVLLILA